MQAQYGFTSDGGSPNSEGPGDRAWQQAKELHMRVMAEEAQRRRN